VHPSGRYFKNSLIEVLRDDFGFENVYSTSSLFSHHVDWCSNRNALAVNRLDRLTSGLMILPTSVARAREMTEEFMASTVRKEYIARCKGEFPEYVLSSLFAGLKAYVLSDL
jgi:tRNA pseudouridine synthase 9